MASGINAINDAQIVDVSGTKITAGTLPASAMDSSTNIETRFNEALADFVVSGCVWSATTGLGGAMTAGVVYVDGKRVAVGSVSSHTFTASKDTYVSVTSSGTVSYAEVTNGAASPVLADGSIYLAKVVTNGSTVTGVTQIGSSSLGAPIYPDNALGAWRTWTPMFANLNVNNGTLVSKYVQRGKTVHCYIKFVMGGTSSIGAATFTLPVTAASQYSAQTSIVGTGYAEDAGVSASNIAFGLMASTTTASVMTLKTDGTYGNFVAIGASIPFSWGSGDYFAGHFAYEAA